MEGELLRFCNETSWLFRIFLIPPAIMTKVFYIFPLQRAYLLCLFICMPIYLSVFIYMAVFLSNLSVYLSVFLSTFLSIYNINM